MIPASIDGESYSQGQTTWQAFHWRRSWELLPYGNEICKNEGACNCECVIGIGDGHIVFLTTPFEVVIHLMDLDILMMSPLNPRRKISLSLTYI